MTRMRWDKAKQPYSPRGYYHRDATKNQLAYMKQLAKTIGVRVPKAKTRGGVAQAIDRLKEQLGPSDSQLRYIKNLNRHLGRPEGPLPKTRAGCSALIDQLKHQTGRKARQQTGEAIGRSETPAGAASSN